MSRSRIRSPDPALPPTWAPSQDRSRAPGHSMSSGRFQFLQGDRRTHLLQPPIIF